MFYKQNSVKCIYLKNLTISWLNKEGKIARCTSYPRRADRHPSDSLSGAHETGSGLILNPDMMAHPDSPHERLLAPAAALDVYQRAKIQDPALNEPTWVQAFMIVLSHLPVEVRAPTPVAALRWHALVVQYFFVVN